MWLTCSLPRRQVGWRLASLPAMLAGPPRVVGLMLTALPKPPSARQLTQDLVALSWLHPQLQKRRATHPTTCSPLQNILWEPRRGRQRWGKTVERKKCIVSCTCFGCALFQSHLATLLLSLGPELQHRALCQTHVNLCKAGPSMPGLLLPLRNIRARQDAGDSELVAQHGELSRC